MYDPPADCKGVVRCNGRLEYADLPAEGKEPIILLRDHHITFLAMMSQEVPSLWI